MADERENSFEITVRQPRILKVGKSLAFNVLNFPHNTEMLTFKSSEDLVGPDRLMIYHPNNPIHPIARRTGFPVAGLFNSDIDIKNTAYPNDDEGFNHYSIRFGSYQPEAQILDVKALLENDLQSGWKKLLQALRDLAKEPRDIHASQMTEDQIMLIYQSYSRFPQH
jgi:hypothetical protein